MTRATVIRRAGMPVLAASICLATGSAAAGTVGIVPPRHPGSNCPTALGADPLRTINACRAREGVGPMRLPSNWPRLTAIQQTFVAIDLERVNRGLEPIRGLTRTLDRLAQKGAQAGEDPPFPSKESGNFGGGSIWWGTGSPLAAVYYWMYEDGPGGGNESCPPAGGRGCWAHRRAILLEQSNLVGGAGHTASNTTFEIIFYPSPGTRRSAFVFTWSRELHFFARRPRPEPVNDSHEHHGAVQQGR